jgi:hypothetical protein
MKSSTSSVIRNQKLLNIYSFDYSTASSAPKMKCYNVSYARKQCVAMLCRFWANLISPVCGGDATIVPGFNLVVSLTMFEHIIFVLMILCCITLQYNLMIWAQSQFPSLRGTRKFLIWPWSSWSSSAMGYEWTPRYELTPLLHQKRRIELLSGYLT